MAKAKAKTPITVIEKEGKITLPDGTVTTPGTLVAKGREASNLEKVIATAILKDKIDTLKATLDGIEETIAFTPKDRIIKGFVSDGLLKEGEEPAIVITTGSKTITVTISTKTDSGFTIDKALEDSISTLPASMVRTTLEKKSVLEKLYDDGSIPTTLTSYFSKHPTEMTTLTTKKSAK